MKAWVALVAAVLSGSCGRLAYDAVMGTPDAAVPAPVPVRVDAGTAVDDRPAVEAAVPDAAPASPDLPAVSDDGPAPDAPSPEAAPVSPDLSAVSDDGPAPDAPSSDAACATGGSLIGVWKLDEMA